MKLFFDTNVIYDVLDSRAPWSQDAARVLSLVDGDAIEGFIAAHGVTTLFYLLRKSVGKEEARAKLRNLTSICRVAPLDHVLVLRALALAWSDFEDAVQAVCAEAVGADYLVTRNPTDFKHSSVPPVAPGELIARLRAREASP